MSPRRAAFSLPLGSSCKSCIFVPVQCYVCSYFSCQQLCLYFEKPTCAVLPQSPCTEPHHPFHCPVSWQAVLLVQSTDSASGLLACSLLLQVPLLGHWMC